MSTRPERPGQSPSAPPSDPTSAATVPSIPRHDALPLASAESAVRECVGAISLVEVTVRSLESQEIACSEQEVLNRALRALWSLHDWIYDRMWPGAAAERGRDRECQP
jgi:hypothetical protein